MAQGEIQLEIDEELIADYLGGFAEAMEEVENNIHRLKNGDANDDVYNDMLRHLHSIKGNARMCELKIPEALAHTIESVVIKFRESGEPYFSDLGETIVIALENVRETSIKIFNQQPLDNTYYQELIEVLENMCEDTSSIRKLSNLFLHLTIDIPLANEDSKTPVKNENDLEIIRLIGIRFDRHCHNNTDVIDNILHLALQLNKAYQNHFNNIQLQAAIYLFDLDSSINGFSSVENKFALNPASVTPGRDILKKLGGWDQAVSILNKTDEAGYELIRLSRFIINQTISPNGEISRTKILVLLKDLMASPAGYSEQWINCLPQALKQLLS